MTFLLTWIESVYECATTSDAPLPNMRIVYLFYSANKLQELYSEMRQAQFHMEATPVGARSPDHPHVLVYVPQETNAAS
jgi:hypothetical protein